MSISLVKKLQRIFLLINRESKMTNKIKLILNQNLKEYQNLSIYEILNIQNLNEKFLKMGKILFLLNYLCSHKKILVSYAIKYLATIEEDIKKVNNFKLENFFAFENKLSIFQKILFESLSQQNMIHPEVLRTEPLLKEANAASSMKDLTGNIDVSHKQDDLKDLISHLFSNKKDDMMEELHDDHTTVDLKKPHVEKNEDKTQIKGSFKRRKGRKELSELDELDNLTKKKKLNIGVN